MATRQTPHETLSCNLNSIPAPPTVSVLFWDEGVVLSRRPSATLNIQTHYLYGWLFLIMISVRVLSVLILLL